MRQDIAAEASGRWPSILSSLGVPDAYLRDKHGECPFGCGGKKSYRFDDKGRGLWICTHCNAGDGFSFLMKSRGIDFVEAKKLVQSVLPKAVVPVPKKERGDVRKRLNEIWRASAPISRFDEVGAYLASRGIEFKKYPSELRRGQAPYYDDGKVIGYFTAMVARVMDNNGKPATLHLTYLKGGKKAPVPSPRKVLSCLPGGSAIRLASCTETLAVAEGIETALAYMQRTGTPTWACISEGGLRKFEPPQGVTKVVVAGDNDTNFVGQAAAYDLAKRMHRKNIAVLVDIPEKAGTDWADAENW